MTRHSSSRGAERGVVRMKVCRGIGREICHCRRDVVQQGVGSRARVGSFGQISTLLLNPKGSHLQKKDSGKSKDLEHVSKRVEGFYEEYSIVKDVPVKNGMTVTVKNCVEKNKNFVHFETDLSGDVVLHWGVCRNNDRRWEVPATPHPLETKIFKKNALRTTLQQKNDGSGSLGLFSLDKDFLGLLFVLKLNDNTWLNYMNRDFYIPLSSENNLANVEGSEASLGDTPEKISEPNEVVAYTDGIISEIRNLVTGISSEKIGKTKSKEAHESILQEIEKLAAEAYSIFRTSSTTFTEESLLDSDTLMPPAKRSSGTGSGYEILCQGFNWESNKSGRWYTELMDKVTELSSLGFTVIWLPPPTQSVSPEGYMPSDLYNLNSRYGSMEELKTLVKTFHKAGIKVLGDAVLNHRCAQYKNQNGIWNIFGGRLNWDDRAVVADDPHFQV
ncbi:hypothetical protein GIB67_007121 [Kingdonia uniflora]|uniref:1,4-alpha-D-glucan glucanohydrolase n=1 Tax=Kingdonia uniflora TaxID=39325 RepID=A0A7J7MLJ2_9MAGN|nr:hypothetical protein GIB67_007121 [Kingdonia uniflora]